MENYRQLVEIQSLFNHIGKHEDLINSQKSRLLFVENQRAKRLDELDDLEIKKDIIGKEIQQLEKDLFTKEKELTKTTEHLSMASNESQMSGLQKELDFLAPKVDLLQESILEKMESMEITEVKISESKVFIDGSLTSLNELKVEVEAEVNTNNKEISNFQSRITLLFEPIEDSVKKSFGSIIERSKDKKAIAFLKGNACSICRTEAPSMQISDIENARTTEYCMGCGKILIPATINAL